MTTTDTDALTERIARAIHLDDLSAGEAEPWGVNAHLMAWYRRNAAAVLPIIAVEVRKAKAEALREAARVMGEWACESLVVIGDELDESTWVEMTAGEWLEHRAVEHETGDPQ